MNRILRLLALLVFGATVASAQSVGGLGGTISSVERWKLTQSTPTGPGKYKKKVLSKGKDTFPVQIAFDGTGADTTGTFTLTDYEDFPVTGTWTIDPRGRVTLAVDQAAYLALVGPEICPGGSCTPSATWTPKPCKFVAKSGKLKLKWHLLLQQANDDGTLVVETYAFKGSGTLSPLP